jgi:hypothetical protein
VQLQQDQATAPEESPNHQEKNNTLAWCKAAQERYQAQLTLFGLLAGFSFSGVLQCLFAPPQPEYQLMINLELAVFTVSSLAFLAATFLLVLAQMTVSNAEHYLQVTGSVPQGSFLATTWPHTSFIFSLLGFCSLLFALATVGFFHSPWTGALSVVGGGFVFVLVTRAFLRFGTDYATGCFAAKQEKG